jgi:carbon-monoxide dehydrogenase medium subunit
MTRLERAPEVRRGWPLLAQAAGAVATPSIRNAATVGGNLGYAEPASDPAPALLCTDAEVVIAGLDGRRTVAITDFFTGFYATSLAAGELVVGLRIPPLPARARSGYVKYCSRSDEDKPLVGVAAVVAPDGSPGRLGEVRIGLGGAAPTAVRARAAEARLRGRVLDQAVIREAAEAAASECDPLSDLMGSADYRREMIRVWVRRLLVRLIDQMGAPSSR